MEYKLKDFSPKKLIPYIEAYLYHNGELPTRVIINNKQYEMKIQISFKEVPCSNQLVP